MSKKVLVVDDDLEALWSCADVLREAGHDVKVCSQPGEALAVFESERPDLVMLDVKMPEKSGLELLDEIRAVDSRVCIIMLSAYGDTETIVRAMKNGADNFADKPLDPAKLTIVVDKELRSRDLEREVRALRGMREEGPAGVKDIVGKSNATERVRKKVLLHADTDDVVLITGETGVGKNLVARALHGESRRRNEALVHRHCGTINPTTFESAVFGHTRGAFTDARYDKKGAIEAAENGTLFLDEIGTLPTDLQAKLLLVIESGAYSRVGAEASVERTNARFITATNIPIHEAVREGRFREDLFHRLKDAWIEVPPLRDRREDIMPLVEHFIEVVSRELHMEPVYLSEIARERLTGYNWPGNVRELRQVVKHVIRTGDENVMESDLMNELQNIDCPGTVQADCTDLKACVETVTGNVERQIIASCLRKFGGNRKKVAGHLKISYRALLYKMKRYGLREYPV